MMPPAMSDVLMLLVPSEQERFVEDCLGYHTCSRDELRDYVWQSDNIRDIGEDRFWFTYQCTRSGNTNECPVDGNWSPWSVWGDCSVTCGSGTQVRSRICTHPLPRNGGRECDGHANEVTGCRVIQACARNETGNGWSVLARASEFLNAYHDEDPELKRKCLYSHCSYQQVQDMVTPPLLADEYWTHLNCYKHFQGCPVDGGWSRWGPWSDCSSNCGEGKAYRVRQCDNPHPLNWGRPCDGSSLDEGPCFDDTCARTVGVFLTPWSPWSECTLPNPNVMCGVGMRVSTRQCHGDIQCDIGEGQRAAEISREVPCELGLCPQYGGFSNWNEWNACSGMCSAGYRLRQRVCNSPPPRGLGMQCEGETYERAECYHDAIFCGGGNPQIVPEYTEWDAWADCSATCNGGVQVRYRSCLMPGQLCRGQLYDYNLCNMDVPCPINGSWSEWSDWAVCSETCGSGTTSRYRECSNPRPYFGGAMCVGETHEESECSNGDCPIDSPEWGEWEDWGTCSSSCGGGSWLRERTCQIMGQNAEGQCAGEVRQLGVCNYQQCPVDGNWASWNEWGGCSVSCDEGMTYRDRTCTDPTPAGDGEICGGFGTEVRHCYRNPCAAADSVVRTFDGTSFMVYRRSAVPTKHLFLYIRFSSETLNGMLVLRRLDNQNAPLVYLGLDNGYPKLFVRNGVAEVTVLGDQIKSPGWNTAEVAISGRTARIRVNNGIPVVGNFSALSTVRVDWDLKMYVGGTLPNLFPNRDEQYLGFVGKIGALRINYQKYSLQKQEEWHGVGLPLVSLNVGDAPGDIDVELPDFSGTEYVTFPCNEANDSRSLDVSVVFKPEMPDGLLVYIPGVQPGSFVAVSLSNSRVTLSLNMGAETVDAESEPIALSEWIMVNIISEGFAGELRVNRGPVIQLNAPEPGETATNRDVTHFRPIGIIYVGGVNPPYETILTLSIGDSKGFAGTIYKISVDSAEYMLRDATLTTNEVYVDSASVSLAGNYREIHATVRSSAWFRCNYSMIPQTEDFVIKWLKWDRILGVTDEIERKDDDPRYPMVSSIRLKNVDIDTYGMYACQIRFGGVAMIANAFGISIYKPTFTMMDNDQLFELLVLMSVAMAFGFVLSVILLSFCKPLRRRFYFFDRVYESVITCVGCERCAIGKSGFLSTFEEMRAVDATFEGFSARRERARLDAQIELRKRDRLKAKLRRGKNKTKDALSRGKNKTREALSSGKSKTRDVLSSGKNNTKDVLRKGKNKTKGALKKLDRSKKQPMKSKKMSPRKGEKSERRSKSSSPRKSEKSERRAEKASVSPKTKRRYEMDIDRLTKRSEETGSSSSGSESTLTDVTPSDSNLMPSQSFTSNYSSNNASAAVAIPAALPAAVEHEPIYMNTEELASAEPVHQPEDDDVADEPIYMNTEALSKKPMSRRESIQAGVQDMGGHMFNLAAGGAAAALSAAIADLGESGTSAAVSAESLAYDLGDIAEGLDGPQEEEEKLEAVEEEPMEE